MSHGVATRACTLQVLLIGLSSMSQGWIAWQTSCAQIELAMKVVAMIAAWCVARHCLVKSASMRRMSCRLWHMPAEACPLQASTGNGVEGYVRTHSRNCLSVRADVCRCSM